MYDGKLDDSFLLIVRYIICIVQHRKDGTIINFETCSFSVHIGYIETKLYATLLIMKPAYMYDPFMFTIIEVTRMHLLKCTK